jgi:hypothetical protein
MIAAASTFMALDRITAAGGFAPAGRRARRDGKFPSRASVQHRRGSVGLTFGQMSGVPGAGSAATPGGVTTTAADGVTTTAAGFGVTTTPVRGLACGYSTSAGHAEAGLR